MTIYDVMIKFGKVPEDLQKDLHIPKRTIENWIYGVNKPSDYVVNMINYYYHNQRIIGTIYNKLEKAQDLIHDNRISEAMEIIDNI